METNELPNGLKQEKTYRAAVRFNEDSSGKVCQEVTIYKDKANAETRVAPVYATRHGRVSVTRASIIIVLKFKKSQPTLDIINDAFDELNQIEDWLGTDNCKEAIEKAEDNIN